MVTQQNTSAPARPQAATPTPIPHIPADYLASYAPELFPWYENRVQGALQKLDYYEVREYQRIVEIMHQIED